VEKIFHNPGAASSAELIAAVLAFTFQIYCDFSGYSDMARGIARMMGFDIIINFNIPYISRTPSEFWQRWHISLSSWLRDYLYVSLGGNRKGSLFTYRNLMITMILGGLWHGAAWTFVFWGAFHGLILVAYRILKVDEWIANRKGSAVVQQLQDLALIALMFFFACVGWLLFRAPNMQTVFAFVGGLNNGAEGMDVFEPFGKVLFYVLPLLVFEGIQIWKKKLEPLAAMPLFMRINLQLFVLFSIYFLSSNTTQKFIYFNF
jgi:D-alanyl-lipoteichoic acid acyltransferase DltB (MBOAT superfamily)